MQCVETVVESGRSGLSKGAVAGIVIGFREWFFYLRTVHASQYPDIAVALAAASALLGFAYWRKRRAARRQANPLGPVDSPKTKFLSALALPRTHARETSSPSPHAWAPLLGGSARRQNRAAEDAEAERPSPIGDSEFFSIPVFDRELPPTPSGMSNMSTAPGASTSAALLASGLGLSTGGASTTTRHSSLHNEMAAYQRDLKVEMRSNGSIGHSSLGHSASTSTTRASGSGGTAGLQSEMAAYQRDLKTAGGVQTGLSTTPSLSTAPSASNAAMAIASGSGGSGVGSHSRRSSLQTEMTEHQITMKAEARAKEGEEGAVEPPPEYSFD